MTKFTAGRFQAWAFVGPENGRSTWVVELHRNGSGEEMSKLNVDFEDLPDLRHVLERAIKAHEEPSFSFRLGTESVRKRQEAADD